MAAIEEKRTDESKDPSLLRDKRLRYCRRCLEPLSFFDSGPWNCWKCGQRFDPHDAKTYTRQRGLLRWKYWFPGFCLAVGSGVLIYALLLATHAWIVLAIAVAALVSLGALLGYGASLKVRVWTIIAMALAICLLSAIVTQEPAMLCFGFVAGVVMQVPTGFGLLCGVLLRVVLEQSNWDQRWYFPAMLIVMASIGGWGFVAA